jgi:hypothetical protein
LIKFGKKGFKHEHKIEDLHQTKLHHYVDVHLFHVELIFNQTALCLLKGIRRSSLKKLVKRKLI